MRRLILFCLTLLATVATQAADFEVGGLYYTISSATERTCTVTYTGSQTTTIYTGQVTIPATVDYDGTTYTVTKIDNYTFYNGTAITAITIPATVTSIGTNAFYGCSALTTLTLPDALTDLGLRACQGCTSLTEIVIPEKVTELAQRTFQDCSALQTVTLPDGLLSMGSYTFQNCSSLTTINLPAGMTTISSYAFDGCKQLQALDLPDGLTTISTYVFRNCSSLTTLTIPTAVTSVGNYACYNCSSLRELSLGASLSSIGTSAFYGCTALESLTSRNTTPPTVATADVFTNVPTSTCVLYVPTQSIEAYAGDSRWSVFEHIEGIGTTLTIDTAEATNITASSATLNAVITPNDDVIVEQGFEYWATTGERIRVVGQIEETMSVDIYDLTPEMTYTFCAYATTEKETTYGAEQTFTTLTYDFEYDGIRYFITSEEEQTVATTYSGTSARQMTTYTGDITIPETVTYNGKEYTVTGIGACTFYYGRENITSITLPTTLTYISEMAFFQCYSIKELVIPEAITRIEDYTFNYCMELERVNIPAGVTYIGTAAFNYCNSLLEATIPAGVTYLGSQAFQACQQLTEIVVPDGVTTIGDFTFTGCTSLVRAVLPAGITSIGTCAFQDCSLLSDFTMPSSATTISDSAFSGCAALTEITLAEGLTTLRSYTFNECTSLRTVTLPSSLTTIYGDAFFGCTALTEITLPAAVTTLYYYAFGDCTALERVYSYNTTPPNCDSATFDGIDAYCALIVPATAKSSYAAATGWKDFYTILDVSEPVVSTLAASNITKSSATLRGQVIVKEETAAISDYGFEYWSSDGATTTLPASDITGSQTLAEAIALTEGQTYSCRAYATTAAGTYYGPTTTFSTADRNADFYADGLFYIYSSANNECVVTFMDTSYNTYAGVITVPETTMYNGVEYNVVGVGESAFRDCPALSAVTLPTSATTIDTWAFYGCSALTEIVIPDNVREVGNQAFNLCNSLTDVTIGRHVSTIGSNTFNCPALQQITLRRATPPTCNRYAFREVDKEACTLYVPEGTADAYAAADVWEEFYNIVEIAIEGIEDLAAPTTTTTESIYTLGGQQISTPQRGVNIVRATDGTTRKVLVR